MQICPIENAFFLETVVWTRCVEIPEFNKCQSYATLFLEQLIK